MTLYGSMHDYYSRNPWHLLATYLYDLIRLPQTQTATSFTLLPISQNSDWFRESKIAPQCNNLWMAILGAQYCFKTNMRIQRWLSLWPDDERVLHWKKKLKPFCHLPYNIMHRIVCRAGFTRSQPYRHSQEITTFCGNIMNILQEYWSTPIQRQGFHRFEWASLDQTNTKHILMFMCLLPRQIFAFQSQAD